MREKRPPDDRANVRLREGSTAVVNENSLDDRHFPLELVDQLLNMGLAASELHLLVLPAEALEQRVACNEPLTLDESDRLLRVVRMLSLAEHVYGSRDRSLAWLRRPLACLDETPDSRAKVQYPESTPMSFLRTDRGARKIEELLTQIDDGLFV